MAVNPLSDLFDSINSDELPDFLPLGGSSGFVAPSAPASPSFSALAPNFVKAGGDILGGIGGFIQGQETAKADEYNAQLVLMEGRFNVEEIGKEQVQTLSTQKAIYAKAGVELEGSPVDTALATATQYEYSKQVATFNAQSQANQLTYEAKVAKQQGQFKLGMGLLEGGLNLASLA